MLHAERLSAAFIPGYHGKTREQEQHLGFRCRRRVVDSPRRVLHAAHVTKGTVYLLGAGPGDPELITMRARRRLEQADLVLYDALVHQELLSHCVPTAELRFVGKRAGRRSERQTQINEAMIEAANQGRNVARLKGGDPYLFGRGSEEAEALAAAGIAFEVVPGVPSPLAATAYAGLSLTHRTLASSVAYITATESPEKDRSSHDWATLATATETLVIFMGMRKLESLMALLVEHGRDAKTPAAVVQWASLPQQKTVVSTVGELASAAKGLGLPSLIIVGNVVRLRDRLRWFDAQPLFSKRVLVPRTREQATIVAQRLRDAGAEPICAPAITLGPPSDSAPLADWLDSGGADCVVFTSANAVEYVWRAMDERALDARFFAGSALCAIGRKTHAALRVRGLNAELVPAKATGEGALATLLEFGEGRTLRFVIPRAEVAREIIPDGLRAAGHEVHVIPTYRNSPPDPAGSKKLLDAVQCSDAILFTSSSTVTNTVALAGIESVSSRVLVSIGPTTTATMRACGLEPNAEATTPSIESLVDSLEAHYGSRS